MRPGKAGHRWCEPAARRCAPAQKDDLTTPNVDESKTAPAPGAGGAAGAPAVTAQPTDQKFDDGIKGRTYPDGYDIAALGPPGP